MNPCELLLRSTAPYYREARVTVARRQTAGRMRHCCARRIDGTGGKRKLLRTSTRWAERHPQGVCRIRKAAEPPTAAQQRVVGAEASRIAALNAASPRAASSNRQAPQLFEPHACNANFLWEGADKGGVSLFEKEIPLPYPHPCRSQGAGRSAYDAALIPRAYEARLFTSRSSRTRWRSS